MLRRNFILFGLLIVFAQGASAAWVDPMLEDQLRRSGSEELVKALVVLRGQVDIPALLSDLDRRGADLSRRHYEVIQAVREKAAETQGPLLSFLNKGKAAKEVHDYREYWIINAVTVWAKTAFFDRLRKHPDIAKIYFSYPIELIAPVGDAIPANAPSAVAAVEPGIAATRAPELWDMGFDGSTALAANCDTGVDGTHPALSSRWRGLEAGVEPAEAWFDPVTNTDFPFDAGSHGTHTMGTIVGDDGGDNRIGMAPGARWIAAGTIDRGSIQQTIDDSILAFQWFADPDGDPGTMEDVPDVVSNSWGISPLYHGVPHCDEQLWAAIDTAEAAGVVVVFAAGNEGSAPMTMRTPGDRIATQVNVFSVGALNQDASTIAGFSSRGPSGCDEETIKPEVCAVGVDVRSSFPGESYGMLSGTSMAAPHVAGAVVLLRDAFPEALSEEIKFALYESAVDLGEAGEDNDYGRGRIDVVEAYFHLQQIMTDSDGKVFIGNIFSCDDIINIRVTDQDLTGPAVEVSMASDTETVPETVSLQAGEREGVYEGFIPTDGAEPAADGLLQLNHGDTIIVSYIDADDGEGGFNLLKTDQALADCAAPIFDGLSGITLDDALVTLFWDPAADAAAVSYRIYRAASSGGQDFGAPLAQVGQSPYNDVDVENNREYFYVVRAVDALGHEDQNTVELSAIPVGPEDIFKENFDSDGFNDWEVIDGGSSDLSWSTDNPGDRSSPYWDGLFAIVDPESVAGFFSVDEQMISPAIDCSRHYDITLQFTHYFSSGLFERGDVEWSTDGVNWRRIRRYQLGSTQEEEHFVLPLMAYQPQVFLRFHYVGSGFAAEYWGVDNIRLRGWPDPNPPTTTTTTTTTSTTTTSTSIPADDDTGDDDTSDDDTVDDDTTDDDAEEDDDSGQDDDSEDASASSGQGDDGGCSC